MSVSCKRYQLKTICSPTGYRSCLGIPPYESEIGFAVVGIANYVLHVHNSTQNPPTHDISYLLHGYRRSDDKPLIS